MDLTLSYAKEDTTWHIPLTTTSATLSGTSPAASNEVEVVIWATTAFSYKLGASPTAVKPVSPATGTRTIPGNVMTRIRIPTGFTIAAVALSGTGDLYMMLGA